MRILVAAAAFSSGMSGIQRHALNLVRCLLLQREVSAVHLVVAPWQRELVRTAASVRMPGSIPISPRWARVRLAGTPGTTASFRCWLVP